MTLIKERIGLRNIIDIIEISDDKKSFIRAHIDKKEVISVHAYPIAFSDKVVDNMINKSYWKVLRK